MLKRIQANTENKIVILTNDSEMSANKSALEMLGEKHGHTFFTITGRKDFRIANKFAGLPMGKIEMAILDQDEYDAKSIIDFAITGEDDSRYVS